MKTSSEIRADFLEFFKGKQHHIVPSAPIIPHNDPTLLFTNAGMNQFKDVFLGTGNRPYKRAADTQKCIRVSGKHNDLEVVGRDTYHHTFFEMLGNWSFGDYFKKEAICWAWELLTQVWGIEKGKLWVTVFSGDPDSGVPADDEAAQIWEQEAGVAPERVLKFDKKDNFWEMGETGPCGPCSEIHIDLGPDRCAHPNDPGHRCGVNAGCPRFIEIWNLVFIQFNRQDEKTLVPLPSKHVDTGMGFERLVAVMQQKRSNYDTDVFSPIMQEISTVTGKKYMAPENAEATDIAFRVISDHIRALSAAFGDGALPGNTGRGYVLRRLLRRAARFGRQGLGMEEPFLYRLVPVVANIFENVFPEIEQRKKHIELLVKSEEESFAHMLTRGIHLFNGMVEEVKKSNQSVIPGEKAYQLYHQDGFPRDLVDLMAREQHLTVDDEGWKKAELEHKDRSKGNQFAYEIPPSLLEGIPPTRFLGYGRFECTAKVLKLIDNDKLILDVTPFYAESGGQVGDTGVISGRDFQFLVKDTQKHGDIYIHLGEIVEYDPDKFPHHVTAYIDRDRRRKIMANHTATHLLHWALRRVLGEHVAQQGSIVEPDRFRFDISHPQKITEEELAKVEKLVNGRIYENIKVLKMVESLENAKKKGAIALFGEKYGETVRVIKIGRYTMELCGGTHAFFTGDLGYFRITSESSVQAGVRRIEAVTRGTAIELAQKQSRLLADIKAQLKITDENMLLARLSSMQEEIKELKKKGAQQSQKGQKENADQILERSKNIQDIRVVLHKLENVPMSELRGLSDMIRKSSEKAAGLIASVMEEKVFMVAFVSDKLLPGASLHAGEILKLAISTIGGGGDTKRAEFAQGQGTHGGEIENVFQKIFAHVEEKLK